MSKGMLEISISTSNERIVITRFIELSLHELDGEIVKKEVHAILDDLFVKSVKERYIVVKAIVPAIERTVIVNL